MKRLPLITSGQTMRQVIGTSAESPDSCKDAGVRICHHYWRIRKGDAFTPTWRDFHLHELPAELIPFLLVLDVRHDPFALVYRFWGSGHTQYHKRDYTGRAVADMETGWSARLLTDQYRQVIEQREPIVFSNRYEGIAEPLYSLRMPLSEDGETVTHLVSYVGRRAVSRKMQQLFETLETEESA